MNRIDLENLLFFHKGLTHHKSDVDTGGTVTLAIGRIARRKGPKSSRC